MRCFATTQTALFTLDSNGTTSLASSWLPKLLNQNRWLNLLEHFLIGRSLAGRTTWFFAKDLRLFGSTATGHCFGTIFRSSGIASFV